MNGKKGKRVDKAVSILLRFTIDLMSKQVIRFMKNKPNHRMQQIGKSHKKSKEICDGMVAVVNDRSVHCVYFFKYLPRMPSILSTVQSVCPQNELHLCALPNTRKYV